MPVGKHIEVPQVLWPLCFDSGPKITHFREEEQWFQQHCSIHRKQCALSQSKPAGKGSFDHCNMHEVIYLLHRSSGAALFNARLNHGVSEKRIWVAIIFTVNAKHLQYRDNKLSRNTCSQWPGSMSDRDEGMKATVTQDFLACHQKCGACHHVEQTTGHRWS